ncbi:hypothetical protein C8R47DRAFT_1214801 [Mycena vitilis]|nr:hypothetical protein C8R47DRAFT_1214801 [Mycena vitilis]
MSNLFSANFWAVNHLRAPFNVPFLILDQARSLYTHGTNPSATLLMLLFPIPWHLPNPDPLPVALRAEKKREAFYKRHANIFLLRNHILFRARDTPTRALYRLYDAICFQDEVEMVHETTYIWYRHTWALNQWPNPRDTDPDRYTVLAAIVEELVRAFNFRLTMGLCRDIRKVRQRTRAERRARIPQPLESVPSWPSAVPPARSRIILMDDEKRKYFENKGRTATAFDQRDILVAAGGMFFV